MANYKIEVLPRYKVPDDPDFMEKMEASWELADEDEERTIHCPVCKHRLIDVYGRNHAAVRVKCQNCKMNVPIDIGIFRTQRRWRKPGFVDFMSRYMDDPITGEGEFASTGRSDGYE